MSRIKRLERITNPKDIRVGDLLLTVDHNRNESIDYVACIDGNKIFTLDHVDDGRHAEEPLDTYVEDYEKVYRIR